MRKELIERLLKEFDKDREVIINNLLLALEEIVLEASNEYEKIILNIKIKRKGSVKNEFMGEKEKKSRGN